MVLDATFSDFTEAAGALEAPGAAFRLACRGDAGAARPPRPNSYMAEALPLTFSWKTAAFWAALTSLELANPKSISGMSSSR